MSLIRLEYIFTRRFAFQLRDHFIHLNWNDPLDAVIEQLKEAYERIATSLGEELRDLQKKPESEIRDYVKDNIRTRPRMIEILNEFHWEPELEY